MTAGRELGLAVQGDFDWDEKPEELRLELDL